MYGYGAVYVRCIFICCFKSDTVYLGLTLLRGLTPARPTLATLALAYHTASADRSRSFREMHINYIYICHHHH